MRKVAFWGQEISWLPSKCFTKISLYSKQFHLHYSKIIFCGWTFTCLFATRTDLRYNKKSFHKDSYLSIVYEDQLILGGQQLVEMFHDYDLHRDKLFYIKEQ